MSEVTYDKHGFAVSRYVGPATLDDRRRYLLHWNRVDSILELSHEEMYEVLDAIIKAMIP